jgi:hypothetical protein
MINYEAQYAAAVLQELHLSSEWVNVDDWRKRIMQGLKCTVNQADDYIRAIKHTLEVNRETRSYRAVKLFVQVAA